MNIMVFMNSITFTIKTLWMIGSTIWFCTIWILWPRWWWLVNMHTINHLMWSEINKNGKWFNSKFSRFYWSVWFKEHDQTKFTPKRQTLIWKFWFLKYFVYELEKRKKLWIQWMDNVSMVMCNKKLKWARDANWQIVNHWFKINIISIT